MNESKTQDAVAQNEKTQKLSLELGKAIDSVDSRLLDITGGLKSGSDDGDIIICSSKCA
ncbi:MULTISPECIES: hypothetical protein [Corallococcus]|uniref:hypothetical protein n=1 Tax=Corallococcus TaxID=83461 RepID=UPI001315234D|nr:MULTISPECIES: hypothetical protein [Corallococcus]